MKCFIFQNQEEVNNNNLPFYDSIKLNLLSGSTLTSRAIYIQNQSDFIVTFPEGEFLVTEENGNTPLYEAGQRIFELVAGSYTLYPSRVGGDYIIAISNASTITYLYGGSGLESVKMYPDLTAFANNRVIKRFGSPNFTYGADYKGDLSCLFYNNTLSSIQSGNNRIPTSVESMVEAAWNFGRRTGTVTFSSSTSNITLNGTTLPGNKNMWFKFNNDVVTVSVQSENTVYATYNGTAWTYTNT